MAGTKQMRIRRKYTYADGSTGTSAKPGTTMLTMECLGTPTEQDGKRVYPVVHAVEVKLSDFPAEITEAAAWHGLSQKLGDANAEVAKRAKDEGIAEDPEKALADLTRDAIEEQMADLAKGFWVTESESKGSTGNVTILLEAILATLADAGQDVTDDLKATIAGNLKNGKGSLSAEEYRKAARAREDIAYHIRRIERERAEERLKTAKAAAKNADKSTLGDLV